MGVVDRECKHVHSTTYPALAPEVMRVGASAKPESTEMEECAANAASAKCECGVRAECGATKKRKKVA
jgi:hypothetical protein